MMRLTALPLMLLIAGCGSETAPEPVPSTEPSPTIAAAPDGATLDRNYAGPESLVGEYRVAGVDDSAVDMGWAMTVSIDETTIRLVSQCVKPEWTYRWDGRVLETEIVPVAICERGRAPAEEAAIAALDNARSVERTPENGLRVEGGGHSITLFSQ